MLSQSLIQYLSGRHAGIAGVRWIALVASFMLTVSVALSGCEQQLSDAEHVQRAKEFQDEGDLASAMIELKNALAQNPDNVEARWLLGNVYLVVRNGVAAEKELRRAQQLGLSEDALTIPLARAVLIQGDYERVLREFGPQINDPKQVAQVHGIRAEALMGLGKLQEAERELAQALAFDPPPVQAQVAKARLTAVQGDSAAAKKWLEKAIAADPKSVDAWSTLGDLERDNRELDKSLQAYSKAIEYGFNNISDRLKRALLYIVQGEKEKAKQDIEIVHRLNPNAPGYHYARGLLALRQQQLTEAQTALERTLTLDETYDPAKFYLGVVHAVQGNYEQADQYLSRYVSAHPTSKSAAEILARVRLQMSNTAGAKSALEPLLQGGEKDAQSLGLLADVALAQGDYSRGIQYLREQVEASGASAQLHTRLGRAYLEQGDREQGVQELQRALELDPEYADARVAIIVDLLKRNEVDDALAEAEKLKQQQPKFPQGYLFAGVIHALKGDNDQAKSDFERALELSPGDPTASVNLASFALRAGDEEKARKLYEDVLKVHPDHLVALLKLSKLEARDGHTEVSLKHLERALKSHPDSLEARDLLARAYLAMGRPGEVVRTAEEGLKQEPKNVGLLEAAASAYMELKRPQPAADKLRTVIQLQPEKVDAYLMLAQAYNDLKEYDSMVSVLKRALERKPDYFAARRVLARAQVFTGDIDGAKRNLALLKQQAPNDPDVLALEGAVLVASGKPQEALAHYRALYEKAPATASMLSLARHMWETGDRSGSLKLQREWVDKHPADIKARAALAEAYTAAGEDQKAVEQYEKILVEQDNNLLALNNLAWALKDRDGRRALKYAERAAEVAPESVQALDTYMVVLLDNGDNSRALRMSDRIGDIIPTAQQGPALLYHRAQALARNGRDSDARQLLTVLLRNKQSDFPSRDEAQKLLEKLSENQ